MHNILLSWLKTRVRAKYIFISLFFLLCLLHFFSRRPLWTDEEVVLFNLQSLGVRELFGPLHHGQAFPRVYLLCIKFLGRQFQYHVLALRLLPFCAMLAAFLIWMKVYRIAAGVGGRWFLGVLAMTGSYSFSYYAAELKPYSFDVLVSGLYCLFVLRQKYRDVQTGKGGIRTFGYLGGLSVLMFFSYAAFFCAAALWTGLFFSAFRNRRHIAQLICFSAACLLVSSLVYWGDVRHGLADKSLNSYWDSYCICLSSPSCFLETFWEGMRRMATGWFGKGKDFMRAASFLIPFLFYGLGRYGLGDLIKNRFQVVGVGDFFAVLWLELLVAGMLRKYPFTGERITLFLAPFVFYVLIRALEDLKPRKFLFHLFQTCFILLCACSYVNTLVLFLKLY